MKIAVTSVVDLERTAHNRAQEFLRPLSRDHDVTVFSIQDWWKDSQEGTGSYRDGLEDFLERIEIVPFTDREIPPVQQEIAGAVRARRLISQMDEAPDLHLNYNTLVSGWRFARILADQGTATVYDIADDLPAMVRRSPQLSDLVKPAAAKFADFMLDRSVNNADRVTVINEPLRESAGLNGSRSQIIPNGVDVDLFHPFDPELPDDLDTSGFVIGYVGVLREWVNFEPVLEAVAELNRGDSKATVSLLIVGSEGGDGHLSAEARRLGIEDHVHLAGTVPYERVPDYINAFDAGLIPFDRSEISNNSLPLKLFEYMACNLQVVSTPISGVRECAEDRIDYASTAAEYVETISSLLESGPDEGTLEANRRWIQDNYSWQAIHEDLEQLLREVAQTG